MAFEAHTDLCRTNHWRRFLKGRGPLRNASAQPLGEDYERSMGLIGS
ncbi:MAG: hypothetical protein ABIF87_14740 [Pseudomonadota bacterium]